MTKPSDDMGIRNTRLRLVQAAMYWGWMELDPYKETEDSHYFDGKEYAEENLDKAIEEYLEARGSLVVPVAE